MRVAAQAHELAAADQGRSQVVGRGGVAAVHLLDERAKAEREEVLLDGPPGPKRVGRDGRATGQLDQREQFLGVEAWRQLFKGPEEEEVALGRGVLHAHDHAQPVGLRALANSVDRVHGVVVRDAHAVQASTPGEFQDISKGKATAWRQVAVHMYIEEHDAS